MSRRWWRCRNVACPEPHGAVLGQLTRDAELMLDPAVVTFRCYLDTRRVIVACPRCGAARDFRGTALLSKCVATPVES
jgi:hypothetical protein